MEVFLTNCSPIYSLIFAIRTCYNSFDKMDSYFVKPQPETVEETQNQINKPVEDFFVIGENDKKLIKNIINKGHHSTLEHISFSFYLKGISRLVLQELVRHRIASYSVKSTRYTLKELKNEKEFTFNEEGIKNASKYINFCGKNEIDVNSVLALENLRKVLISEKFTNDEIKYCLPECYKTNVYFTINARSLRNFFNLRLSKNAHFEIQELSKEILNKIPKSHLILFEDIIYK